MDIRQAAAKLIESTSEVVVSIRAPSQTSSVEAFVRAYNSFYTSVGQIIQKTPDAQQRQLLSDTAQNSKDQAINVLQRLRSSQV